MLRRHKPFRGSLEAAISLEHQAMWIRGGAIGLACLLAAADVCAQPAGTANSGRTIENIITEQASAAPKSPAGPSVPVVLGARVGEQPDRTRFVIELSDPLNLRVFTLSNPKRVVIDMPEVLWRLQGPERPSAASAVRAYRYGLFRAGDSRFVIDLNRPVKPAEPLILPPSNGFGYRFVLDLFPTSEANFEAGAGWPSDLRAREAAAERVVPVSASTGPVLAPAPPPLKL